MGIQTHSSVAKPAVLEKEIADYRNSRTGLLTNPGSDFLAWENLPQDLLSTLRPSTRRDLKSQFPSDWPTLQHTFADAYYGTGHDMIVGSPTDSRQYVSILPAIVATFSRGNVTISSADTSVNPVISPNLLSDPRDQEIAVAAFKRARQIFNTSAIDPIRNGPEVYPGANVSSDTEILEAIMKQASPIWHASGTCKMGRSEDPKAVIDYQARVFGVSGLRVIDASAFPFLVPCHPQATVCKFLNPLTVSDKLKAKICADALAEKIVSKILKG